MLYPSCSKRLQTGIEFKKVEHDDPDNRSDLEELKVVAEQTKRRDSTEPWSAILKMRCNFSALLLQLWATAVVEGRLGDNALRRQQL